MNEIEHECRRFFIWNLETLVTPNYSIWIFTHLKLRLKWVKIIYIWQNGGQLFSNIADWFYILFLKGDT